MTFQRIAAWLIGIAIGLAATLALPVAHAEEYDEQTITEVNEHFQTGAKLYYDGEYDAAIAEFSAAHAKIPNAVFLYNISLAHARKGETELALQTAREAQNFGGLGEEETKQNEARIVALERVLAANDAAVQIAAVQPPPVDPLFDFGPAGWVGSALVVAGVVGYGGVLLIDRAIADDVDQYREAAARGDVVEYEDLKDDIRPRQRAGRIVFVLSSLAVASGAVLLVYDLVIDKKSDSTLSIVPMPGGAGVSFHRRF